MAYSNFTLQAAQKTFQLEIVQSIGIFAETEEIEPSSELSKALAKKVPLAVAIGTGKAKSEMIVADVLVELREHFEHRISLFSGIDFNVDTENDLTGVCDFLVSLSPNQDYLESPVIILVEAKKDDLITGLGQCVADMIAAQRFNAEKLQPHYQEQREFFLSYSSRRSSTTARWTSAMTSASLTPLFFS